MRRLLCFATAVAASTTISDCDVKHASAATLVSALRRGDFGCAATLAGAVDATDLAVNEALMELRSAEQRLKDVREALRTSETSTGRGIAPSHQWAQSGDEVFVSVKFAHKWDAPATLVGFDDVEAVEFKEELITVKARKGSKRFDLEIVPLRPIDPANSSWVSASVGRLTLTLTKAQNRSWWPRLSRDKTKPQNQGVWWDKQELYDKEKDGVEREEKARLKVELTERLKTPEDKLAETVEAKLRADEEALTDEEEAAPRPTDEALSANLKAERRKGLCRKQARRERKEAEEDGRSRVTKEQARTQLALEDVDDWLKYAEQQIDADAKKESAGIGGLTSSDGVPETLPDVPAADALMRRRARKSGLPVEKKKKKKKKKEKKKKDEPSAKDDL